MFITINNNITNTNNNQHKSKNYNQDEEMFILYEIVCKQPQQPPHEQIEKGV